MNSSLISKIEKAKRYAEEPDRVQFQALEATFRGDNGTHTIRLSGDEWICECDHFQVHGLCSSRHDPAASLRREPLRRRAIHARTTHRHRVS